MARVMRHVVRVVTGRIKRRMGVQRLVVQHVVVRLGIRVGLVAALAEHLARIRLVRLRRAVRVGLLGQRRTPHLTVVG